MKVGLTYDKEAFILIVLIALFVAWGAKESGLLKATALSFITGLF